jgi:spore maturation protein SpmA
MLNYIWLTMVILAVVLGGINGKMDGSFKENI